MGPGFQCGYIDQFVTSRADAGSQNGQQFRVPVTDIEGGVDDTGSDEGRGPRPEYALLLIDPLLDLSFDDVKHLLLLGMLMEVVSACGAEVHFEDHQVLRVRSYRTAEPGHRAPLHVFASDVY